MLGGKKKLLICGLHLFCRCFEKVGAENCYLGRTLRSPYGFVEPEASSSAPLAKPRAVSPVES